MRRSFHLPRLAIGTAVPVAVLALLLPAAAPAAATPKRSCIRGGAEIEAASRSVRVVRVRARRTGDETRRERLLACWRASGRRVEVAEELDFGDDNRAYTTVRIVQDRYVGVVAHNEGGQAESVVARVYDARTRRRLHDSSECERVQQGDLTGVLDVVFLHGGGMAMTCGRLLLYRDAAAGLETIEPPGTWVRQLGVSQHHHGYGQRLFWVVGTDQGDVNKSMAL